MRLGSSRFSQDFLGKRFSTIRLVDRYVSFGQRVIRTARLVAIPRGVAIGGQRPDRFAARHDPVPANFKRHVEPNAKTVVEGDKGAVRGNYPRATAQRNARSLSILQDIVKREGFDFPKKGFTVLLDNLCR